MEIYENCTQEDLLSGLFKCLCTLEEIESVSAYGSCVAISLKSGKKVIFCGESKLKSLHCNGDFKSRICYISLNKFGHGVGCCIWTEGGDITMRWDRSSNMSTEFTIFTDR